MDELNKKPEEGQANVADKVETGGEKIQEFDYKTYERVEEKATNTKTTTALVLGICSIVFAFIFSIVGVVLGILGIVFAVKAKKMEGKSTMATAGLVCSIVGLVFSSLLVVCTVALLGSLISAGIMDEAFHDAIINDMYY